MTDESSSGARMSRVGNAAAVLLALVYLVFVALQWLDPQADNVVWARRQELLTGLEALAFASVGALLGTTVQRHAVCQAEERAKEAETDAATNRRDAEKGRALHANIESKRAAVARSAVTDRGDDVVRGFPTGLGASSLDELAEIARAYDEGA